MKHIPSVKLLLLFILPVLYSSVAESFDTELLLYSLKIGDTSTYQSDCKNEGSGYIGASNGTCQITTSVIQIPGDSIKHKKVDIPVSFQIFIDGVVSTQDLFSVYYGINGVYTLLWERKGSDLLSIAINPMQNCIISSIKPGSDLDFKIEAHSSSSDTKIGIKEFFKVGYPVVSGTNTKFSTNSKFVFKNLSTKVDGNSVNVEWSCILDCKTYFIIEKSRDGISYTNIGKVNANAQSTSLLQFSFTDTSKFVSKVVYYRIKRNLKQNVFAYSEVIAFNGTQFANLNPKDKPCLGKCDIVINSSNMEDVYITVYDVFGNVVKTKFESVQNDKKEELRVNKDNYLQPVFYIKRIDTGKEIIDISEGNPK
ncbi:MAG: hypothetical protein IPO21_17305 [Bacteroidales bacterium]|nr:hypothetical protein [Bacteroidales bacterium]